MLPFSIGSGDAYLSFTHKIRNARALESLPFRLINWHRAQKRSRSKFPQRDATPQPSAAFTFNLRMTLGELGKQDEA